MGGAGGSTGTVRYAGYLEDYHDSLLDNGLVALTATDKLGMMLKDAFNSLGPQAPLGNPYLVQEAYNPDTALAGMYSSIADLYNDIVDLESHTVIAAEVTAFDDSLTSRLVSIALPKYMELKRDICFVQSDSLDIGEVLLYAEKDREVSMFEANTKLEWARFYVQVMQHVTTMLVDFHKVKVTVKHDEEQRDAEIDRLRANWRLDTLTKAGQFMGILGGGTLVPEKASKMGSALSMGLAGASAGAMVGGPWGAAIGGMLGVGASFA